jgi:hypothetical protein
VSGKVTESATGSPIPFANVVFTGTTVGAITDFDGNFRVRINENIDSLEVRYIGFITRIKPLKSGNPQIINFQLDEDVQTLGEVVILAGENPAFPVLRRIVKSKKQNDKRSLEAFEYEAYVKIEMDMDNISEKLKKGKVMSQITSVLDSIETIAGEDGQAILPFFISEAISRYYYRNDPVMRREHVLKTKITGIGVTDGTSTSQVIGASFQEYNFYKNWLNIVNKEFVSPIADGWKLYYDYDLIDSLLVEGDSCYRLDFYPKNTQDLAFKGTMWITMTDFALKRIDAHVPNTSNVNYIEKIKVQQDLFKTKEGPWLPHKTRVVIDVSQFTGYTAGFLAKFYISTKDYSINKPKPIKFYQNPVSMEEDVRMHNASYWAEHRHDSLTTTEVHVYEMIDTLRNIPTVKLGTDLGKFLVNRYHKIGKLDIGPYTVFFGDNNIEGIRLGFGARTNYAFSKSLTLGGYGAYGFRDQRFKHWVYGDYILSRRKWTTIRLEHQNDLEQIWLLTNTIPPSSLFFTFSRFGVLKEPYLLNKIKLTLQHQLSRGFNQTISFTSQHFQPQYNFSFTPDKQEPSNVLSDFYLTEVSFKTKFAKDEAFIIDDNRRVSLGTIRWPSITMTYTYGMPNVLNGDLEYHKLEFSIRKRQKMGFLGVSRFSFTGGQIWGDVPYPIAFNPIGNETPLYASSFYNMMRFFEFSSDRFMAMRINHHFEGLLLNKIPLMKKLKWRLVGNANIIYGRMKQSNIDLVIYEQDENGMDIIPFYTLNKRPYVELGYGIENIFKILKIDAFHRLTYLNHQNVNKFGLKFSLQFIL